MHLLFSVYLKMLVLYSPFFVLSCFISLSRGFGPRDRKRMAWRVALAALIASVALYLFGRYIFILFGITADAFRIGAGSVLFISALGMAQGRAAVQSDNVQQDVTIVPLTIPLTVGPGTIGALLVMGVGQGWEAKLISLVAIFLACLTLGTTLYLSDRIERLLGVGGWFFWRGGAGGVGWLEARRGAGLGVFDRLAYTNRRMVWIARFQPDSEYLLALDRAGMRSQ